MRSAEVVVGEPILSLGDMALGGAVYVAHEAPPDMDREPEDGSAWW